MYTLMKASELDHQELEDVEINLLLNGIYLHYGYDFRNYARPTIRRRIKYRMRAEGLATVTELLNLVLHNRSAMERLFDDFSIHVTEMFRDPKFFLEYRRTVVPFLRDLPAIRIWHAGCSTGEEVFSMAILLQEEGLYDKSTIYATDMNAALLERAAKGLFPLDKMKQYTKNYLMSGGVRSFSEYYTVMHNVVQFHPCLLRNMAFLQHNLATDHSFNHFHVIICRNVLIYFNEVLQKRVLHLFHGSLVPSGFLGLGSKEGLHPSLKVSMFTEVNREHRIYIKKD